MNLSSSQSKSKMWVTVAPGSKVYDKVINSSGNERQILNQCDGIQSRSKWAAYEQAYEQLVYAKVSKNIKWSRQILS